MTHSITTPTRSTRKTAVASALVAALGGSLLCSNALAANLTFSFTGSSSDGLFTMLDPNGAPLQNSSYPYYGDTTWGYGIRTQVSGTVTIDTTTLSGSMTIQPFEFYGSGAAVAHDITFTNASSDPVNTGGATLLLGNLKFDWNGNNNIPVTIVWDASGLMTAINGGLAVNDVVAGGAGCTTCATPASDGITKGKFPIGPAPIATAAFDTSNSGAPDYTAALPLASDPNSVGGSPMQTSPFPAFNANFDFVTLKLIDNGSGPAFTQPADVNFTAPQQNTPATISVDLGTVTDEGSGVTVEYSTDGGNNWIADNGTNTISVNASGTVTTLQVDWRATASGGATSIKTQNVTVTITDSTVPVFTSTPANVDVNVNSTSENVCFGTISATDNVDPTPTEQWSLDNFTWVNDNNTDNCSTGFGPNANTVYWRAVDDTGNTATYQQTVTLNLPTGIVGKACTVDLATAGQRAVDALFTMRGPSGAVTPAGVIDTTVSGWIDTTVTCAPGTEDTCTNVGAALTTQQPFYGSLWDATPIRLFGPGDYTFETCPLPRQNVGTVADPKYASLMDGSTNCDDLTTPMPLTMHVGAGQLGAHMLFEWSGNPAIDVAVVWDVGCKQYMLTTTDPDGDGILGSRMVDGPFKNWNAAFDLKTATGVTPIADGGFTTSVPAVQNPDGGKSPLPLTVDNAVPATENPAAVRSCVGGCFGFTTTQLQSGTDGAGAYQYARVVLPLSEAIPFWSQYFKYNNAAWSRFVIDGRNNVMTAPMDAGSCPEPGGTYNQTQTGRIDDQLVYGDGCVQLTIEDGGPNDADGTVDASVTDPGGVAEVPAAPLPSPKTSGGCSLSSTQAGAASGGAWWLLGGLLGWMGWKRRKSVIR
jgi:hypothetical protein